MSLCVTMYFLSIKINAAKNRIFKNTCTVASFFPRPQDLTPDKNLLTNVLNPCPLLKFKG